MSLAFELNELGKYGYIKIDELVPGQKYKVHDLKVHECTFNGINRKSVRVDIDDGYLILPERYDQKVKTLHTANVKNLYISQHGRQKGNRFDIHFSEEEQKA